MCEALLARQDRHDAVIHIHEETDTSCGHEVAESRKQNDETGFYTIPNFYGELIKSSENMFIS